MAKVILTDVGSTLTNSAASTINENSDRIAAAIEKTLSRNGTGPNNMEADLDMDSNDILNAGTVSTDVLVLNGETLTPSDLAALPATVMMKPTYDPQGKNADAFIRANHTGSLPNSALDQRIVVVADDTNRVTYPDFSSLVVDGDWSPAFNAAMSVRRNVDVPVRDYLIKSQISFQQEGQTLNGMGVARPNAKLSGSGPRLVYDVSLGTTPMLHMEYTGHIGRLAFLGPSKGTGVAVIARKPIDYGVAYEDTDADITECTFYDLADALQHWNRGLNFKDNSVALTTRGAVFEGFDSANFVDDGGNAFDNLPFGFRAMTVDNNRFHAVDVAINNTGLNASSLRELSVQGNNLDIGTMLFNGGLMSGIICGNRIDNYNGTTGAVRFTTAISDLTFSNNLINGRSDVLPVNLIIFQQAVTSMTMQSNTLRGCTGNAVTFSGAVTNSTIGSNSIAAVGGTATQAAILFGAAVTDTTICANAFNQNSPAYAVRGQSGATWTRVTVQNNVRNNAANGYGIFTDGGGNSIQT